MKKSVTVIESGEGRIKVGCDAAVCSGCKSEMFCRGRDNTFEVENPKGIKVEKGEKKENEESLHSLSSRVGEK